MYVHTFHAQTTKARFDIELVFVPLKPLRGGRGVLVAEVNFRAKRLRLLLPGGRTLCNRKFLVWEALEGAERESGEGRGHRPVSQLAWEFDFCSTSSPGTECLLKIPRQAASGPSDRRAAITVDVKLNLREDRSPRCGKAE